MARYFYRYGDMWLYLDGRSKSEAEDRVGEFADEILTKNQAERRAEADHELRTCIENSGLCDLMCS